MMQNSTKDMIRTMHLLTIHYSNRVLIQRQFLTVLCVKMVLKGFIAYYIP